MYDFQVTDWIFVLFDFLYKSVVDDGVAWVARWLHVAMWLMWLMWLDAPARHVAHVAHVAARRGGQYSGQYYSLSVAYNTGPVLHPSSGA